MNKVVKGIIHVGIIGTIAATVYVGLALRAIWKNVNDSWDD